MTDSVIRRFMKDAENGQEQHYNHGGFLQQFDADKDGQIGLEDFKKIPSNSEKARNVK